MLNARDAEWAHSERHGSDCAFEGDVPFAGLGFNVTVLRPGQPKGLYHGENSQEAFLLLSGECLLVVEGQERVLRQWDFVHCPPWTDHVLIGAGDAPCVLLAAGARFEGGYEAIEIRFPIAEAALTHDAGATDEKLSPEEIRATLRYKAGRYREGDLPF